MSILVSPHNEKEEEVLLAFLKTLGYDFNTDIENNVVEAFLNQYNSQMENAEKEIEKGEFIIQEDVEAYFLNRRKQLNDNKME